MHQERGASAPRGSRNRTCKGVRLLRWTNACAQERGASAPRGSRQRICSGVAQLFGGHPTHTLASASAVTVPHPLRADARRSCVGMRTFAGEIATFAMHERTCTRSGGRQPPVARGNARATAFAPMSVRLPTVHQRTPTQSWCYIFDNTHGGLTRGALAPGESAPACAWRFPLHARSPNHCGLTPAALPSERERLPAKLPLLRWTNAHAPGAGGVSPSWFTATHLQRRGAIVRGTSDPHTGERQRSYGTTSTAGSRPPLLRRNANVCRRNCDFCDARMHGEQKRGANA